MSIRLCDSPTHVDVPIEDDSDTEVMNDEHDALPFGLPPFTGGNFQKYCNGLDPRKKLLAMCMTDQSGKFYKNLSAAQRKDPELLSAALTVNPLALANACPELQADPVFVLRAAIVAGATLVFPFFRHAAPDLRKNKEFVLKIVGINGPSIKYMDDSLCSDKDIAMTAMKSVPLNIPGRDMSSRRLASIVFRSVDQSLRDDRDFVLEYVRRGGGRAIMACDEKWRTDREIVLAAVTENAMAFSQAPPSLRADPEVVLAAVRRRPGIFIYISPLLRDDPSFVLRAIAVNPKVYAWVVSPLRENIVIMMAAVCADGSLLKKLPAEFMNDVPITLAAVKADGTALAYASIEMRKNAEVINAAVEENPAFGRWSLRRDGGKARAKSARQAK